MASLTGRALAAPAGNAKACITSTQLLLLDPCTSKTKYQRCITRMSLHLSRRLRLVEHQRMQTSHSIIITYPGWLTLA